MLQILKSLSDTSKQNLIKSMGNFMNSLQLQLKCGSLLLLGSVRPLISFINFSEKEHENILCSLKELSTCLNTNDDLHISRAIFPY
jgi:hypothetical protein